MNSARSSEPDRNFANADDPPFSRLFVLTPKAASEDEIRKYFSKCGHVQDVWLVKDRQTGENRGICYIKYARASEAALAVERLNGSMIDGHSRPLKVLISNSRRDGSGRDPCEAERMLRLFILVPKTNFMNNDLKKAFELFGEIESVQIVTDRTTGENRGFGYVKFKKASDAARALEECDPSFKPKFAEPLKSRRRTHATFHLDSDTASWCSQVAYGPPSAKRNKHSRPSSSVWPEPPHAPVSTEKQSSQKSQLLSYNFVQSKPAHVLVGRCHKAIPLHFVHKLFDLIPGLQDFRPWPTSFEDPCPNLVATVASITASLNCQTLPDQHQQYIIRYFDEDMANYARHKLNGFEFPIGYTVHIDAWANSGSRGSEASTVDNQTQVDGYGRVPSSSACALDFNNESCSTQVKRKTPSYLYNTCLTSGSQDTPPPLCTATANTHIPPGLNVPFTCFVSAKSSNENKILPQVSGLEKFSFLAPSVTKKIEQSTAAKITNNCRLSKVCAEYSLSPHALATQKMHDDHEHNDTFANHTNNINMTQSNRAGGYILRYDKIDDIGMLSYRRRCFQYQINFDASDLEDTGFCSVHLPIEKPMANEDVPVAKVLRISASVSIPTDVLKNVFCRFGHLMDANMNGNVFGFILYANVASAEWAIKIMNGELIAGIRIFLFDVADDSQTMNDRQQTDFICQMPN